MRCTHEGSHSDLSTPTSRSPESTSSQACSLSIIVTVCRSCPADRRLLSSFCPVTGSRIYPKMDNQLEPYRALQRLTEPYSIARFARHLKFLGWQSRPLICFCQAYQRLKLKRQWRPSGIPMDSRWFQSSCSVSTIGQTFAWSVFRVFTWLVLCNPNSRSKQPVVFKFSFSAPK